MGTIQSAVNKGILTTSALYTQVKGESKAKQQLAKTQKNYDLYKKRMRTRLNNYKSQIKQYNAEKKQMAMENAVDQYQQAKQIKPTNMIKTNYGWMPKEIIDKAEEIK